MLSPLEQFHVTVLVLIKLKTEFPNITITNVTFMLMMATMLMFFLVVGVLAYSSIVPSVWSYTLMKVYYVLLEMMSGMKNKAALQHFPYVATVFALIMSSNALGLVPYAFTSTSQVMITFTLSVCTFLGMTALGLYLNKFSFVEFFVPRGISNPALKVFLILMEVLSYLMSPLSLGIRLFANMLAGHVLLYMLGAFMYVIVVLDVILLWTFPLGIMVLVMLLEICIAFIQTYVFTMLVIIYIKDMFNVHH